MRFVSASAGARAAAAPRRASPRWRLAGAAPPQRAARATVRARRDDEATSSPGDPNERLREELRRSLRAEADHSRDPHRLDDAEAVTRDTRGIRDAGSAKEIGASRRYAITVREREIFRYTLPDFFPDFNDTPLEARRGAGLDDDLSTADLSTASGKPRGGPSDDDAKKNRNRPYVWRRGVLAGVERSDPLDVIARERERFERALTATTGEKTEETRDEDVPPMRIRKAASASESAHAASSVVSGSKLETRGQNSKRRVIPPPPRREGGAELGAEELGLVSKTLLGLTLFFYLVALVATTSRAFLGDSQPAPIPPEGGALPSRAPAAVPDSIRGTRAGEMWREKLGGTGGNARDEP